MPTPVMIWRCDYCQRYRQANKSRILKHEKECWFNPAVRACPTCDHHSPTACAKRIRESGHNVRPKIGCEDWEQTAPEMTDSE